MRSFHHDIRHHHAVIGVNGAGVFARHCTQPRTEPDLIDRQHRKK